MTNFTQSRPPSAYRVAYCRIVWPPSISSTWPVT